MLKKVLTSLNKFHKNHQDYMNYISITRIISSRDCGLYLNWLEISMSESGTLYSELIGKKKEERCAHKIITLNQLQDIFYLLIFGNFLSLILDDRIFKIIQ